MFLARLWSTHFVQSLCEVEFIFSFIFHKILLQTSLLQPKNSYFFVKLATDRYQRKQLQVNLSQKIDT